MNREAVNQMREILFRGRQTDKDKWVYGVPVKATSKDESEIIIIESVFACDEYLCRGCEFTPVIPSTVGQYTGLTDKNGKKIFEGDILKATYHSKTNYVLGEVVFENGTFKLSVFGEVKDGEFSFICSVDDIDKKTSRYAIENNFIFRGFLLEVIGNIHDNPELLKGGGEGC